MCSPSPCAVGIPNQRSLLLVGSGNPTGDNAGETEHLKPKPNLPGLRPKSSKGQDLERFVRTLKLPLPGPVGPARMRKEGGYGKSPYATTANLRGGKLRSFFVCRRVFLDFSASVSARRIARVFFERRSLGTNFLPA